MTKLNHGTVRYLKRPEQGYYVNYTPPNGGTPLCVEGTPRCVGVVMIGSRGWYYRLPGKPHGVGPFTTCAEATDHLISANYPSAG